MGMLEDLGGYLDTNSALTLGVDLFLGLMPENVSNCVSVYENGGRSPDFTMGSNNLPIIENPEFQIIVRNSSYQTGRSLADSTYRVMTQIANLTINSVEYLRVVAISSPALMERDSNKRVLFTTNFYVTRKTP